jgi:hypothetical protein
MKARQLIGSAAYGPDVLGAMYSAFDTAWEQFKPHVGSGALAVEKACINLANAILALARDDERDIQALTDKAVAAMHAMPRD